MAALVERNASKAVAQTETNEIPRVRGKTAAMQEDDRATVRHPPVKVVEPHAVEDNVVVLRQNDLGLHVCDGGRELQVLEFFVCHVRSGRGCTLRSGVN